MTNTIEKAINNVHKKLYNAIPNGRFTNPKVEYLGEDLGNEHMLVSFDCHIRNAWDGQIRVSKITYLFSQSIVNKRRCTSERISNEKAQECREYFSK